MGRLKELGIWVVLVLAFFIFSNGLIYLVLHGEELGMKIYNMTHKDEIVNVEKQKTEIRQNAHRGMNTSLHIDKMLNL